MTSTDLLDRLEAAFAKRRAGLLVTDAGRWAVFVQPFDGRCRPQLVGCFDDENDACEAGVSSPIGRRFLVKAIRAEDRVVSVPRVVLAD